MKNKNIVIFTKTNWNESPRIRHQLTRLLSSYGHNVTFFEKSCSTQLKTIKYKKDKINFIRHFELFHHQLRPFEFLVKLNQFVAKYFIQKNIKNENIDLVINFNYDYPFLKDLFPDKKVITIINDDFVSQAKFWMTKSIRNQLLDTCKNSDLVLAVSYPLVEQLKEYNQNTHIFLPWAQNEYIEPTIVAIKKDVVLYWGFIDHRIDWDVIEYLLKKKIKLRFVGSVQTKIFSKIEKCNEYTTFELIDPSSLETLNMDDIVCSLLPYDPKRNEMNAVTVNNRVFQLLSYGLPLVYSNLPNLLKSPTTVISKCKTNEEYFNVIKYFSNNFDLVQSDIKIFLKDHYAQNRYEYFTNKIEEIDSDN
ncbi:MAG: hypothetical protein COA66_14095 [Arcobacter sp.]|nr:MAG: hypothetical protein COA66_14095 [Arcobacter sp.]